MFTGRERELGLLDSLWRKTTSSLVVCQGRRRIGKSTLIREFAKRSKARFLEFTGLAPSANTTNRSQLTNFSEQLSQYLHFPGITSESWFQAFEQLSALIDTKGKTVVLLDEISWLGGYAPDFPGYLKNAWDLHFSRRSNLIVVLCGSVSSWIADNILNNTGFVGRVSLQITLKELSPFECLSFWGASARHLSAVEIFDLLSVTGGVPRYLEEIDPHKTTSENIRRLFFQREGFLFTDFNQIFSDIFGEQSKNKQRILNILASGSRSLNAIAKELGTERNGHLTRNLYELELAGFVSRDLGYNPSTGKPSRSPLFRICDNYTRFFLKYVEPHYDTIKKNIYDFSSLNALPELDSIMGLQFEALVLNHINVFFNKLGLNRARILSIGPWYQAPRKKERQGVQVDLMIQTTRTVYVIEIKRRQYIGPEIEKEVEGKIDKIKLAHGLSVRTGLIYLGKLAPSVIESGYFDAIVSAEELLGQ